MSEDRRPSFRIHRLDQPDEADEPHYRAFWQVGGQTYRVRVWSLAQWQRVPESERPLDVSPLAGPAWMMLRPVDSHVAKGSLRGAKRAVPLDAASEPSPSRSPLK